MNNNEKLMDAVLVHLKKLIILTENGEEEELEKLVNMACKVSNQLIKIENRELNNEEVIESDEESDDEPSDEDDDDYDNE